jgi:hypothetical protein
MSNKIDILREEYYDLKEKVEEVAKELVVDVLTRFPDELVGFNCNMGSYYFYDKDDRHYNAFVELYFNDKMEVSDDIKYVKGDISDKCKLAIRDCIREFIDLANIFGGAIYFNFKFPID